MIRLTRLTSLPLVDATITILEVATIVVATTMTMNQVCAKATPALPKHGRTPASQNDQPCTDQVNKNDPFCVAVLLGCDEITEGNLVIRSGPMNISYVNYCRNEVREHHGDIDYLRQKMAPQLLFDCQNNDDNSLYDCEQADHQLHAYWDAIENVKTTLLCSPRMEPKSP